MTLPINNSLLSVNSQIPPPANDHLPNDMLVEIFSRLRDYKDLFQASQVCRSWHNIATIPEMGLPDLGSDYSFLEDPNIEFIADGLRKYENCYRQYASENDQFLFKISEENPDCYAIIPSRTRPSLEFLKIDNNDRRFLVPDHGIIIFYDCNNFKVCLDIHHLSGGPRSYTTFDIHPSGLYACSLQEYSLRIDLLDAECNHKASMKDQTENLDDRRLHGLRFQNDTLIAAFTAVKKYDNREFDRDHVEREAQKFNASHKYAINSPFSDVVTYCLVVDFIRIYSLDGNILENIYFNKNIDQFVCNEKHIAVLCNDNNNNWSKTLYLINTQNPKNPIEIDLPIGERTLKIGKDFVASGNGTSIYIWNVKTGDFIQEIPGHLMDIIDNHLVTYSEGKIHFVILKGKSYLERSFSLPYLNSFKFESGKYLLGICNSTNNTVKVIKITPKAKTPSIPTQETPPNSQQGKANLITRIGRFFRGSKSSDKEKQ